jgi:hypothetical protein
MDGYRGRQSWAWNGEIGPLLEAAREERGVSLKEAERCTNIRWRYLEGLEREDPGELPDRSYVQGFLGSYAEFLGLDVDELSRRFKRYNGDRKRLRRRDDVREGGTGDHAADSETGDERRGGRAADLRGLGKGALITLSLAALALGLVVAASYIMREDSILSDSPIVGGEPPAEDAPGEEGGTPRQPPQTVDTTTPTPVLKGPENGASQEDGDAFRARVLVRGSESWISVESDSEVVYTGIAEPGFSQSFESGETFSVTSGNAGAVELRLDGIEYGRLGENGEVTSRSFTFKRDRKSAGQ